MRRILSFVLLLGLLAPSCGDFTFYLSTRGGAHISGIVVWQGAPAAGAVVRVLRDGAPVGGSVTTDAAGHFCIAAPSFTEVSVTAHWVPAEVTAVTWFGSASVGSGDFGPCAGQPGVEIQLCETPI